MQCTGFACPDSPRTATLAIFNPNPVSHQLSPFTDFRYIPSFTSILKLKIFPLSVFLLIDCTLSRMLETHGTMGIAARSRMIISALQDGLRVLAPSLRMQPYYQPSSAT
jgi:hypothetical protein